MLLERFDERKRQGALSWSFCYAKMVSCELTKEKKHAFPQCCNFRAKVELTTGKLQMAFILQTEKEASFFHSLSGQLFIEDAQNLVG